MEATAATAACSSDRPSGGDRPTLITTRTTISPYPYTVYSVPPAPVIVEQPVYTQQPAAAPEGYWYYCESSKAYYPSVPMCAEAWIKVPPRSE